MIALSAPAAAGHFIPAIETTIGGTVYYENKEFKNGGDNYLHTSPLIYPPVN